MKRIEFYWNSNDDCGIIGFQVFYVDDACQIDGRGSAHSGEGVSSEAFDFEPGEYIATGYMKTSKRVIEVGFTTNFGNSPRLSTVKSMTNINLLIPKEKINPVSSVCHQ